MNLHFAFRRIEATDALKVKIEKRVKKFEKYITYPMEVHVRLSLENRLHCAEITCHAEHKILVAVAKTSDLYESIDMSAHKIEAQLRKEREKHKGHKLAHKVARSKKLASDVGAVLPHTGKGVRVRD